MSHCISAIVTKQSDLLSNVSSFRSLPQGFALLLDSVQNRQALIQQDFAVITTDYFGGCGEQTCTIFRKGSVELTCDKCKLTRPPDSEIMRNIDAGLKVLGVVRTDTSDEFDAIDLGNYRSNSDIED